MKALLRWTFAAVVALSALSRAQSAEKKDAGLGSGSARNSKADIELVRPIKSTKLMNAS